MSASVQACSTAQIARPPTTLPYSSVMHCLCHTCNTTVVAAYEAHTSALAVCHDSRSTHCFYDSNDTYHCLRVKYIDPAHVARRRLKTFDVSDVSNTATVATVVITIIIMSVIRLIPIIIIMWRYSVAMHAMLMQHLQHPVLVAFMVWSYCS